MSPFHHTLAQIHAHSPYLAQLLARHADLPEALASEGGERVFGAELAALHAAARATATQEECMRALRLSKGRVALLAALLDISGQWTLPQVTRALSEFAGSCLALALDRLLLQAAERGEIAPVSADAPSRESGVIVLGMGKLGGFELNYSSDIDLIVLYERERLGYRGRQTEQHLMNRLALALVQMMQERTPEGYVFRTDLRLRPDPASTPPAVSTAGALYYYESLGQNWERAAMIKARPVAGDIEAGAQFLQQISPFMWRKYLDFAAIQDIHSIKRQMDARNKRDINILGHNVKIGLGGIREIEFFAQIHQLIWGGRNAGLRLRGTCETLDAITEAGLVPESTRDTLEAAYRYLRVLEHRLQMVADQQTHELPKTPEGIAHIAAFMGYAGAEDFTRDTLRHLHAVHAIFRDAFRTGASEELGDQGNLVFTGVSHDPDTLETLRSMGFDEPETVSELVMGWHHGSRRCTRTKRARELLTELMPSLLRALAETADADAAFRNFDQFLARMPAGVQLFSLFANNPDLLKLIADIMGSAPVLAESLSRHPDLLESVLFAGFYGPLPDTENLRAQLRETLVHAQDFEDRMEYLRRFRNERQFQVGVQLLRGHVDAPACGRFLSGLAELCVQEALASVEEVFVRQYGRIPGGRFAVLGLGRLGSREMTFGSDLDLVFIYDTPDFEAPSDGKKSYPAGVYYNRLAQRLHTALTTLGRQGRLYAVDTRLRPFGEQGLSAVSVKAFRHYFDTDAWTFEYMALTRARAVAGDAAFADELGALIRALLARPRDAEQLRRDVADMRARVEREFPAESPWDLKHARGGLMDVDFLAQYLLLAHGAALSPREGLRAEEIFTLLQKHGLLTESDAATLADAARFLNHLHAVLRLASPDTFTVREAPPGLRKLVAAAAGAPELEAALLRLEAVETGVREAYSRILASPT